MNKPMQDKQNLCKAMTKEEHIKEHYKPMNTTKTELLQRLDKETEKKLKSILTNMVVDLAMTTDPGTDKKILDENTIKLGQFFSKALDRYRDSVREEEKEKIEKLDAYYVLNGSIEKHKGGHLLDKYNVLKILND